MKYMSNRNHTILDFFQSFASLHPDIILIFSLDGKLISPRQHINEYLGYASSEHIVLKDLLSKEYYEAAVDAFYETVRGQTNSLTIRINDQHGEQIHFLATFIPIKLQEGDVQNVFLRLRDITQETLLEQSNKLKSKEIVTMNDNYKYIFNHLNVGIWMYESLTGAITFASQGLADIMQISLLQIYEHPEYWKEMINKEHTEELYKKYDCLKQGETIEHTYQIIDGKGQRKWLFEQTIPRMNEQGEVTHLFGMIIDVTEETEMQEELLFLATHDALTGLPNYRYLDTKLDAYIESSEIEKLAAFYVEIDNFHWILDYLGYQIGDLVLKKISKRMNRMLPESGFLAKMDRDSFVVLLPNYKTKNDVTTIAEKFMHVVEETIEVQGYEFHVTASIGISFYPHTSMNKLMLMENAHTALYYAKHLGKNNYQVYSFDRDISAHKKYMLERDLREALKNDEFELYYQPQIDPKDGAIQSVEALIRWHHKDWGVVAPDEFIPIAEEKHLIHQMEDWVFQTVCKQMNLWREQGLPAYRVSINVSPLRFLKPGFVENIRQSLTTYDILAKDIELEITENMMLEDKKNIERTLSIISDLGLGIALDDFGKGYSSFHYLQKYDVDTIKIDKMFIQQLDAADEKNQAIVRSIIQLAKALHIRVVAEGVEEIEHLQFLIDEDCDLVQGYLFSKPVSVQEVEKSLQARYIQPIKQKEYKPSDHERRDDLRVHFPKHLQARMHIQEVHNHSLNMGAAHILVENISVHGLRFLTSLRLPMSSKLKLVFDFVLLGEPFMIEGKLVYNSDEKMDIFSYGVELQMEDSDHERLEKILGELKKLYEIDAEFPETKLIEERPHIYLRDKRM